MLEIGAEYVPVGDPSDELVVLVGDGETLVVGGGEGLDGVLERVRSAEARHITGELRAPCRRRIRG